MTKPRDFHGQFERDASYGNSRIGNATVGAASGPVLATNERRRQAIFINDSDTVIYLAKGPTALLNRGIRLNANGGTYIETPDTLAYIYLGPYAAISSAATKNLCITEDM